MFCRKCGKEIGEVKFCPFCGEETEMNHSNAAYKGTAHEVMQKIRNFGQVKLINIISLFSALIGVIVRIKNNEIEVVYSALASDDYFVLSEQGKVAMLWIMAVQILLCGILYYDAKKTSYIFKSDMVLAIVMLAVQVLAMVLRMPAPY